MEEDGDGRDVEMTILALSESAKLLPYIIGSKKAVKVYLKVSRLKHTLALPHPLHVDVPQYLVLGPRRCAHIGIPCNQTISSLKR